jgi:hypothetical protein
MGVVIVLRSYGSCTGKHLLTTEMVQISRCCWRRGLVLREKSAEVGEIGVMQSISQCLVIWPQHKYRVGIAMRRRCAEPSYPVKRTCCRNKYRIWQVPCSEQPSPAMFSIILQRLAKQSRLSSVLAQPFRFEVIQISALGHNPSFSRNEHRESSGAYAAILD